MSSESDIHVRGEVECGLIGGGGLLWCHGMVREDEIAARKCQCQADDIIRAENLSYRSGWHACV